MKLKAQYFVKFMHAIGPVFEAESADVRARVPETI